VCILFLFFFVWAAGCLAIPLGSFLLTILCGMVGVGVLEEVPCLGVRRFFARGGSLAVF